MIRTLSMMTLSAIAAFGISTSAQACPGEVLKIRQLTLHDSGEVTRTIYVQQIPKDGAPASREFMPVVRDRVTLGVNDDITLNASPTMVDAIHTAKIRVESQDRDSQGIFSTTYRIVESTQGTFGGKHKKAIERAYMATVKGTYLGDGAYARGGCGSVTTKELDLESSTDVRL